MVEKFFSFLNWCPVKILITKWMKELCLTIVKYFLVFEFLFMAEKLWITFVSIQIIYFPGKKKGKFHLVDTESCTANQSRWMLWFLGPVSITIIIFVKLLYSLFNSKLLFCCCCCDVNDIKVKQSPTLSSSWWKNMLWFKL